MSSVLPYNENELASRLAAGDEKAFVQIYNKYWNKIYYLALVYLKSIQLAEDAVQEVFLKLWTSRRQVADVQNLEAFIFIVGRNQVIDAFKRKATMQAFSHEASDWLPDDFLLPHDQVDLKLLKKKISDAVEKLPPQQKKIFKMTREEGLSHEEIAQRLGIDKKTVKNHIVRALNTLRSVLHERDLLLALLFVEWIVTRE